MATDSTKVRVAVAGEVSMAATSAAAPTGTASTLTGFTGLGYVSSDGVKEKAERSSTDIRAWQNGDNVRTVVTEGKLSYTFKLLETKKETVELYYGTTVTQAVSEGNFVIIPTATGGRRSFVIDVIDGENLERVYIPAGEVTEVGEKVYANGEPIGYEVTVTAYPSTAIAGGSAKVWSTALKS